MTQGTISIPPGGSSTLIGDVTGSGSGTVSTTVAYVGGVSAATIASVVGSLGVTQPANTVSAGPASGASATPTFRALVNADLPALPSGDILVGNASNVPTNTAVTGDISLTNAGVTAIGANVVTNAKAAQMAANTIKGNNTGSTANASDLTVSQATAMLNAFVGDSGSGGTKGLVPAPSQYSGLAGNFLSANGSFAYVDQSKNINNSFSLVAQLATGGTAGTVKYESTSIFTSITTGKNYAVGAGFIGSPTLTIWDISNQTSPTLAGTFTASGGGTYNCTIGVVGGVQYAFVGYNSGSHFVVVDLTNPTAPVQKSTTVITGSPGSIYGVSFLNGYVYCATQSTGLVVMDVSVSGSPAAPVQTFQQGGGAKSFGVFAIGTNVYTTMFSTASPFTVRQIVSWTLSGAGSRSVPSLLQSLQVTSAGEALGISISGNTAFVTVATAGAYNINLVDITTPNAMTNLSVINSTNPFGSAFYATASGNYLYVPSGSNATYGGAIDAYDITTRTAPKHIAQVTTGNPNDGFGTIALFGGYMFVANYGVPASNNGYLNVFTQIQNTVVAGNIISSTLAYTPAVPGNWSTVPTTVQQALDLIAVHLSPV